MLTIQPWWGSSKLAHTNTSPPPQQSFPQQQCGGRCLTTYPVINTVPTVMIALLKVVDDKRTTSTRSWWGDLPSRNNTKWASHKFYLKPAPFPSQGLMSTPVRDGMITKQRHHMVRLHEDILFLRGSTATATADVQFPARDADLHCRFKPLEKAIRVLMPGSA